MNTITATAQYGIVIRRDAVRRKSVSYNELLRALEVETPADENEDLLSFGPSFGEEAMNTFISRLQGLGLAYVDDFFALSFDLPSWITLRISLTQETPPDRAVIP
jgi:hypothetical protein